MPPELNSQLVEYRPPSLIAIFGWRVSYLIFGLVILFIIAPSGFLLLRDHPEDIGQGPDGTPPRSVEDFKKVYGD